MTGLFPSALFNSDIHNLQTETLHQQFELVRSIFLLSSVMKSTYTSWKLFDTFGSWNIREKLSKIWWVQEASRYVSVIWQLCSQVKQRTMNGNSAYGSHVMQYGDIGLSKNNLSLYLGTNPANDKFPFLEKNSLVPPSKAVNQRDADLVHFWDKVSYVWKMFYYYLFF